MIAKIEGKWGLASFKIDSQHYPLRNSFILDSGTTIHICNQRERLEDLRLPLPGDCVWAGNTQVWIQGYGTVRIRARDLTGERIIRLDNAALCPDIHCNLVSFRLLRQQGIWWDNQAEPTMLRKRDKRAEAEGLHPSNHGLPLKACSFTKLGSVVTLANTQLPRIKRGLFSYSP